MKLQHVSLCLSALLCAGEAAAHEGHGSSGNGIWHYLIEPFHVAGLLLPIIAVVAIGYLLLRRRSKSRQ